jgi:hypothetical protein
MAYKTTGGAVSTRFALYPISSDHGTVTTTPELVIDAVIKTGHNATTVEVEQIKSDTEFWDVINEFAHAVTSDAGGGNTETILLDDGTEVADGGSSSSSSDQNFVFVSVGGENADGIKTTVGIGTITPDSGSHDQEGNKKDRPKLALTLVNALDDVVLAADLFPTSIYAAAQTTTLLTGKSKKVDFLAPAA